MDLIVHVPVLAAISEINFSKKDRTAAISVRHHNTLGGIRMIGVLKEANEYGHETKPIRRTPISLQASTDTGGQFTSENAMVTLPITKETAMIDFRLSIANMGVVHERRQTVSEPPIRYTGEQAISLFNPLSNSQFRAAPTEKQGAPSSEEFISEMSAHFDPQHVHQIWVAALQRRADDPEGAITLARTLLETVCKHILDEADTPNAESAELPALYHVTVKQLQLAPGQQSEQIFRQVLGCCQTIVEGIGALRNRLSDAHGKGKNPARPTPRHAELAVNLAGTLATFLIGSWQARERDAKGEQSV